MRLPEIQTVLAPTSQVEYVCKTKALFTPPEWASSLCLGTHFIDEGAGFGEGLVSSLFSLKNPPSPECLKDMGGHRPGGCEVGGAHGEEAASFKK